MSMTQNHFWNTDEKILLGLKQCFLENFTDWLEKSNHPHISSLRKGIRISFLPITELEALQEILDVILVEPDADYFWYDHRDKLTWATPEQEHRTIVRSSCASDLVHGQSIKFDKDKIKSFLRDIKLNTILNEN